MAAGSAATEPMATLIESTLAAGESAGLGPRPAGITVLKGPRKARARAWAKIFEKYLGEIERLLDITRLTVVCRTAEGVAWVSFDLGFHVVRPFLTCEALLTIIHQPALGVMPRARSQCFSKLLACMVVAHIELVPACNPMFWYPFHLFVRSFEPFGAESSTFRASRIACTRRSGRTMRRADTGKLGGRAGRRAGGRRRRERREGGGRVTLGFAPALSKAPASCLRPGGVVVCPDHRPAWSAPVREPRHPADVDIAPACPRCSPPLSFPRPPPPPPPPLAATCWGTSGCLARVR